MTSKKKRYILVCNKGFAFSSNISFNVGDWQVPASSREMCEMDLVKFGDNASCWSIREWEEAQAEREKLKAVRVENHAS